MKVLAAEIQFAEGTEYIASVTFATMGSDTPANQLFRGKLRDVEYERSVSFAQWRGDRSVSPPVQDIVLRNGDGALDSWLNKTIKDRLVILRVGEHGTPYSTWPVRARLTGDRIVHADANSIAIRFKSRLAVLDKQATAVWPESTSNPEIRGSRKPIAIGKLTYADGVLNQHLSNFERFYSVSDVPIHSIYNWWSRHGGDPPGWFAQGLPEGLFGMRRRSATSNPGPDDRVCMEMRGAVRLGTEVLGSTGEFTSWSGGLPVGWSVIGTSVTEGSGTCIIAGEAVAITCICFTIGVTYYVEVLATMSAGVWQIMNGGTVIHYQAVDAQLHSSARTWKVCFTATSSGLSIAIPVGATGNVSIDRVRVWPATPVDKARAWIEHLCIDRGGLVAADLDTASLDALQTAKPYDLAYASPDGGDLGALLYATLDSLNAALFEGLDGKLVATWLRSPASMDAVGTILDADLMTGWQWEDDEMEGLSTTLQCGVNYSPLSEAELETLTTLMTLSQPTIESLRRLDRKVSSAVAPISHYSRAADQAASASLIVSTSDAQTEVNARCTLANTRRRFGRTTLRDLDKFSTMVPGQCWTVSSARWGEFKVLVALVAGSLLGTKPTIRLRVWR